MPLLISMVDLPRQWDDAVHLGLLAALFALALALGWSIMRRRDARLPLRRLLGRLATEQTTIGIFLRGMFVPGSEFFSRAPEYPPGTSGTLTVHKWIGIPEVISAADLRATTDILRLLVAANPDVDVAYRSVEKDRKVWNEDAIAIGSHFKSQQILEGCEPRLVAFRNPDAFRSVLSQEVFESRGNADFGLIYKGSHPASHRAFWVIMGLDELATEAAAQFLRVNASALLRLTGSGPFAAILAVDRLQGAQSAALRSLQPRPVWWRRLLYQKTLSRLSGQRSTGQP
jgi:hypothetical protein